MEYDFIEFDNQELPPGKNWVDMEDAINAELQELLDTCEFIVTSYNTMYLSDSVKLDIGHRGPCLMQKGSFMIDWYYNIYGGYSSRLQKKVKKGLNIPDWDSPPISAPIHE